MRPSALDTPLTGPITTYKHAQGFTVLRMTEIAGGLREKFPEPRFPCCSWGVHETSDFWSCHCAVQTLPDIRTDRAGAEEIIAQQNPDAEMNRGRYAAAHRPTLVTCVSCITFGSKSDSVGIRAVSHAQGHAVLEIPRPEDQAAEEEQA